MSRFLMMLVYLLFSLGYRRSSYPLVDEFLHPEKLLARLRILLPGVEKAPRAGS
jgi:hypothetical protein